MKPSTVENLKVSQLIKKFFIFYGTTRFTTVYLEFHLHSLRLLRFFLRTKATLPVFLKEISVLHYHV
jgi:hypothetical protein